MSVTVSVPATSANLGPGFDSIGLALDIRDTVIARLSDEPGVRVRIHGNGSDVLPKDENHLIAQVILETAENFGISVAGLDLECTNTIPQGRGLGSSASAIIAGLVIARELFAPQLHTSEVLQRANVIEGHADNISACLLGGLTVARWDNLDDVRASSLITHPDVVAVVAVPDAELSTHKARGLLPDSVPYVDAVFNSSRAAALVVALTSDPSLLFDATDDRLHQEYRRSAYPDAMALVDRLRGQGIASAISGAGPSVLALVTRDHSEEAVKLISGTGFEPRVVEISPVGAEVL
jgi:homoserine kinase